ncbi:unnamed protein product [Adineta ricciae]|uniref:DDE-1 domain-containing protein n=1 Tax=Adineta ricciae TaxID=249248 RepID=A0A815WVW4_ADIRI|nr:unnamed protein product [Adineta ricciae]CAF1652093.1 unnamed protein product [Adineta ricciae]
MVKSRVNYPKENFPLAVEEYNNGASSSDLTKKYGIPGSTIRNHKSNPNLKVGAGRPTLLSNEQEKYLVELLKSLETIGCRLTKPTALQISSDYVQRITGKEIEVGRKWLKNFLQRWQNELKVIKEEKLESARRNGFTEDVRCRWFEKLNSILEKNSLKTRPHAIYNCDETGFSDATACELVIVSHDTKHAFEQSGGGGKSFTTNLVCSNAAGEILPPFVIYSAKQLNPDWTFGGPVGSYYGVSESGWITKNLFFEWFKSFVDQTKDVSKPMLLIMDNHPAHISIEVIEMARQHQILLLLLPPHCTHALQPLDAVTFSAVKSSWKRVVGKYFSKSHRKTIRKRDLPALLNKLYTSEFTPKQIVAGFTRTGVWPYDPTAMKHKVARKPLVENLNQSSSGSSTNAQSASTQAFSIINDRSLQNSSVALLPPSDSVDHEAAIMVLDLIDKFIEDTNRTANGAASNNITTEPAATTNNLSFTTNLSTSSSLNAAPDVFQSLFANSNFSLNMPCRSSSNTHDLSRFPSFLSSSGFGDNASNDFNLTPIDKSSDITLSLNTSSMCKQHRQSTDSMPDVSLYEFDFEEDDDGQKILGFNPRTVPITRSDSSIRSNNRRQHVSILDFEEETDKENQISMGLNSAVVPASTNQSQGLHLGQLNINKQETNSISSAQLSPSTAVRSIVSDLFRQHTFRSTSPPKTSKRKRTEGIYGEEITTSNMLNDLKEKASQSNQAKRTKRTITAPVSTLPVDPKRAAQSKRKPRKTTSETITSSQATRAISTVQASTFTSSN